MTESADPQRVYWLLNDICVQLGFCSAAREQERFEALVPLGADAFADAVLVSEGMNPEYEKQWRRDLRDFIATRFAQWKTAGAA